MRLFDENGPRYVRLDDDVSFQILRTNPKLTTNTKLMYDGENLYMDSYSAVPLLSTMEYKHHRVWKTGLFNRDIRNFLLGTNTAAFEVGQDVKDTIIPSDYDNQFENMYWCGVESINSKVYPQEMGCVAPLYLRKKRPNYFVIFRTDDPANTNTNPDYNDREFDFNKDILKKSRIVKAFDLREGTPIGNYIKRYVEQRDFRYDQSIYVNFSSHEIYYYGIDKKSGVLTQKVESFEEQLLKNDNTIMKMDDWITSGFERNNLIFPYIINLEFLFDDNDIEEFKFARYFGVYCNDIDLYDVNIKGSINNDDKYTVLTCDWSTEDHVVMDSDKFYYMKDKYGDIFTVYGSSVPGHYRIPGTVDPEWFTGFEPSTISTYAERLDGVGKAVMILEINKELAPGDTVMINKTIYDKVTQDGVLVGITPRVQKVVTFTATSQLGAGEAYDTSFSCRGLLRDIARALAAVIRNCEIESLQWVTAFSIDNKVIIRAIYPGINMNDIFDVMFDRVVIDGNKITKLTDFFRGGTNYNGCMFKVNSSDRDMFFDDSGTDRDSARFIKCGAGKENAEILTLIPYIVDDKRIDDNYSVIITDNHGKFANVSKTNQIEIVDKFYAKLGMLSFFPVRDFDFDTVYSRYGEYSLMRKELDSISKYIGGDSTMWFTIPYGRFFYDNNSNADNEYDYYFENFIPELSTVNKTVPFINKWGYADESKDSCENPYRLNTSKIFDACNFSANTFMQKGDIMEYTHSMPYYVNSLYGGKSNSQYDISVSQNNDLRNEYQYLDIEGIMEEYSLGPDLEGWVNFFSKRTNDGKDPFLKIFGDTSGTLFSNKRFNKKYSRFLMGNDVNRATTLFRGVKFEIVEMDRGKETHTGKYNDYRFSFIYVPVNITKESDKHTVNFIKNDVFKFVVGIVFFNIEEDLSGREFNKAFVYANSMGFLNLENTGGQSYGGGENEPGDIFDWDDSGGTNPGDDGTVAKSITINTNRKNTKVTFSITRGDQVVVNETTRNVTESNVDSPIYVSNGGLIKSGDIFHYSAAIYGEQSDIPLESPKTGDLVLDGTRTQRLSVEFEAVIPSQYYLKINNSEKDDQVFDVDYAGGVVSLNIDTNVEYTVNITSRGGNYSFFTVDDQSYDKMVSIKCDPGYKSINFSFDAFNYVPANMTETFGERKKESYPSLTPYTYGADVSSMYRILDVSIDVTDDKYKGDVESRICHLSQYSVYANPNKQYVTLSMTTDKANMKLSANGGTLNFKIKPECFWYIRSEMLDDGSPDALQFTPAQGRPSDELVDIEMKWTRDISDPSKSRTVLMQICGILNDEVICSVDTIGTKKFTHSWEVLPYDSETPSDDQIPEP